MQKKKSIVEGSQTSQWEKDLKAEGKKQFYKKIMIWAGIAGACFLGLALLVTFADKTGSTNNTPVENANLPAPRATDIEIGNPSAKIVVTEYADFQCPACAIYNPVVNQILQEYKGKVKLIYRFFPLTSVHKNSVISGQAGYGAWKMGKFAEMKDLLYENQAKWENLSDPRETFIGYAKDLGLKTDEFTNAMNSSEAKKAVLKGETEALGLGLNSTPSFFIGNKYFVPKGIDTFKDLINEQLK